ncbi:MAG: hypothetical protein HQL73_02720 [Magnetococcales bacterium]|nr:hypothetical protein [Magnetococcales bacterium]
MPTAQMVLPCAGNRIGTWDISTAVYHSSLSVSAQVTNPQGIYFTPDGKVMLVTDNYNSGSPYSRICKYTMTKPWDLSTASYVNSYTYSSNGFNGGMFSDDGTALFFRNSTALYQRACSTPFDVSTATGLGGSDYEPTTYPGTYNGMSFCIDGTVLFATQATSASIRQYNLKSNFYVGNGASQGNTSFSSQTSSVGGMWARNDGKKFYLAGMTTPTVYQYTLATPGALSSANYDSKSFSMSAKFSYCYGIYISPDGLNLFAVGNNANVWRWTLT